MATQETIKQMRVSENGPLRDLEDTTARAGVSALQTALASLQSALDTLMGTEDITDEIDTYNEIKDFLDGFDVNDPNLSSQLVQLNTAINNLTTALQDKANASALQTAVSNLQAAINGKANSDDVYNKTEVDTKVANKQDNIPDLATIRTNAAKGIADVSTPATPDGTAVITLANGDTFTLNLNHTHPQYASKKTVTNTNESAVTLSADVIYDLGTVAGDKAISLPSTVDAAAEYEFRFSYTSGNITLPSGVAVANDATFSPTAGKVYQVVICGGILYFSETTISA